MNVKRILPVGLYVRDIDASEDNTDSENILEDHIMTDHLCDHLVPDLCIHREHLFGKFIQAKIRNRRQNIRCLDIPAGGRGCLQVDCGRQDAAQQKPRHFLGKRNHVFPENRCDDCGCRSDDLIAEIDRPGGGKISDPMVVDDFQNRCPADSVHRMLKLVVIDQDQLLIVIIHDLIPGDIADQKILLVHDRIRAETGGGHFLVDVIRQFMTVEGSHFFSHNQADR